MCFIKKFILTLLFYLSFFNLSSGYISRFLELPTNSLEYKILLSPDSFPLKVSSLVASGVRENFLSNYLNNIENYKNEILKSISGESETQKARVIFDFMHSNILKTYGEFNNSMDVLLKTGKFNCLSSTILYSIFLEEFGLKFKAIALPTHVFTLLYADDREIDVENTTPYGFDIRTNEKAQEAFRKLTGFIYTRSPDKIQLIDKKGLLAALYANFSFVDAKNKNYTSSFQNALKAYAIFPEIKLVASNTMAAYIDYANFLKERKEFEKCLNILKEAMQILPEKQIFTNMYLSILDEYLAFLVKTTNEQIPLNFVKNEQKEIELPVEIKENLYYYIYEKNKNQKNFDKLFEIYKDGLYEIPSSTKLKELISLSFYNVVELEVKNWTNALNNESKVLNWFNTFQKDSKNKQILEVYYTEIAYRFSKTNEIDRAIKIVLRGKEVIQDSKELDNFLASLYSIKAISYVEQKDYENALLYFNMAKKINKDDKNLLKNLRMVYRLRVYDKINEKDFKKAKIYTEEGLKEFPDDEKLLYYREYLKDK